MSLGRAESTQQPSSHPTLSKRIITAKDPIQAHKVVNTPRTENKFPLSFTTDSTAPVRTQVLQEERGRTGLQRANLLWQKTIGGSQIDFAYDATQLNNGDIVVVGESSSSDFDIQENKGFSDLLIVKLK